MKSAQDRVQILNALASDAGVVPGDPFYWYSVADAGFNYVDDQCGAYFQQLFFLNRDRERFKSGLGAASAATAAILGVTGASSATLTIVAQAFGLSIAGTDIGTAAYLYQLPPSTTEGFVRQMQLAYREGAAARRLLINSAPTAYHAVQEYLSLCLPPTIEAKIAEHIGAARATPDPITVARSASFGVNLSTPFVPDRRQVRAAVGLDFAPAPLRAPDVPVGPSPPKVVPFEKQDAGLSEFERTIPNDTWRLIKQTLCVSPPDTPSSDAQTRSHIREFLAGYRSVAVGAVKPEITPRSLDWLNRAIGRFPACTTSSYGVGVYTRFPVTQVDGFLQAALKARQVTLPSYSAEEAIKALHTAYGLPPSEVLDGQVWPLIQRDGHAQVPGAGDRPNQ